MSLHVTSKWLRATGVAGALVLSLGLSSKALAEDSVAEARETIAVFKKADPAIEAYFKSASGYVVFPTVTKGAFVVGGAGGAGILFENGKPVGKSSIGQATFGLQAGGQAYSEVIFFENAATLTDFKKGNFGLSAQASAVALSAGTAANAKYQSGVAVLTVSKTGLMVEASVGGQWFHYDALPACASPSASVAPTAASVPSAGPSKASGDKAALGAAPAACAPTS